MIYFSFLAALGAPGLAFGPLLLVALAGAAEQQTDFICKFPNGRFNDCAWSCENNRRGEKTCRLSRPKVTCVRRRCDANGQWRDESRLTGLRAKQACSSPTVVVGVCDY